MTHACILGLQGTSLSGEERAFFRDVAPWGFILFKRNVESPDQVRALTASLRECLGRTDAPILIDQEGGRVQRLGPPHWPKYPPGRAYGTLKGNDPLLRREIARLGARLLADDLSALGINVDCVPVLDVPTPGAHDIIGDRAYGEDVATVASLGPRRRRGPDRRRRPAGDQAYPRPRPSRRRQPFGPAGGRRASGQPRGPRFRTLPGPLGHADGDERPRCLHGPRRQASGHHFANGDFQGHPRLDRLFRPADDRRPFDEGPGRRFRRAGAGCPGRRLRHGPALQWRHGRDEGRGQGRAALGRQGPQAGGRGAGANRQGPRTGRRGRGSARFEAAFT